MTTPEVATPPTETVPLLTTVEDINDDGAVAVSSTAALVTDPKPAATESEAAKEAKEAALAEVFAVERMKFLIKDVATEAAYRATDLLETSQAIRILVNGHFMREHE